MPFLQIGEANYYYEQHGQGAPLVFVAGYSCDHFFWDKVVAELTDEFQIWVFDNRAIGQTKDKGEVLSLETMAQDTFKLIQALNISKPTIIGQSMGGMIAQLLAKQYPEIMDNLILLNTVPDISLRTLMALDRFVKLLHEKASIDTVIEASMPWFFSSKFLKDPQNIAAFKGSIVNNPFPQSLADLERQLHALTVFDIKQHNLKIKTPTLVMLADQDIVCLPEESKALSNYLEQAKWVSMPGGHSSPIEVPKDIAHHIKQFLNQKKIRKIV